MSSNGSATTMWSFPRTIRTPTRTGRMRSIISWRWMFRTSRGRRFSGTTARDCTGSNETFTTKDTKFTKNKSSLQARKETFYFLDFVTFVVHENYIKELRHHGKPLALRHRAAAGFF